MQSDARRWSGRQSAAQAGCGSNEQRQRKQAQRGADHALMVDQARTFSTQFRSERGPAILRRTRATVALTMDPLAQLAALGLELPAAPSSKAGGNYVQAKTSGGRVYLCGVISQTADGILTGTAGLDRSIEDGYAAARACALMQMGILQEHLGSLNRVRSILSVNGYVNAVAGFEDSPRIINGASDLLIAVFGEAGRHVRAAIGVSALPRNALVELQMIVEI
jgi:enamine deaminase RidA (YjgF/YER057c/UK114 family)